MATSTKENFGALKAVADEFPGVGVRFERGGKHYRAIATFGDQSRFYVVSSSKMERRTMMNAVSGFRRMIREMTAA